MDVSIIIVTYNTCAMTLDCLRSVKRETRRIGHQLIVVDNGSRDGSAEAIARDFPDATVMAEQKNHGFAMANNLAARIAAGEYLLLLNSDTVVLDGAIEKLLHFARSHPECSIFGGRTLFGDGSLNPKSCWRRPTPWAAFSAASGLMSLFPRSAIFASESFGSWPRNTERLVDIVSGCFFLIRRKVWEELGGFDPAFYMYGEESDLCLRAGRLGHRCMICPEATIIHYGGASERVRAEKMVKLFRAKALLAERHWQAGTQWLGWLCLDLWALTRLIAFGVLRIVEPRCQEAYASWCSVWNRRAEWHTANDMGASGSGQPRAQPADAANGPVVGIRSSREDPPSDC